MYDTEGTHLLTSVTQKVQYNIQAFGFDFLLIRIRIRTAPAMYGTLFVDRSHLSANPADGAGSAG